MKIYEYNMSYFFSICVYIWPWNCLNFQFILGQNDLPVNKSGSKYRRSKIFSIDTDEYNDLSHDEAHKHDKGFHIIL